VNRSPADHALIFQSQSSTLTSPVSPRAELPRVDAPEARGHYDELRDAGGKVRPHYEQVISDLQRRDTSGVKRLSDTARRLLAERGVTFNIYDAKGLDTPWQMDPVPFVISSREWEGIEKALIQRATLLNAIITDSYGPQLLIRKGDMPAAMVLGQPGLSAPLSWHQTAERQAAAGLWCRHRPLARRPVVGDLRPHADSDGRRLCLGEPSDHLAAAAGGVS
jgi:hypothetical protein